MSSTLHSTILTAGDDLISLREAITAANTNLPFGDAPAGDGGGIVDEITFAPSLIGQSIMLGRRGTDHYR